MRLIVLVWFGLVISGSSAFCADGAQAVSLFKQGKYKESLPLFEKIVRDRPNDVNALYYYAVALHRSGKVVEAKAKYYDLMTRFSGTQAGQQAAKVLFPSGANGGARMPGGMSRVQQGSSEQRSAFATFTRGRDAESPDYSSLPHEARVYFKREGNSLMVDAQVNNRPITMVFDTGAEVCAFGKNHLRELGIQPPQGAATGMAVGVGDGGAIPTWTMRADLKLGSIVRKNLPISVQENLPGSPLLGQTFFRDFRYTIDNGANSIHFVIKQPASTMLSNSRSYSSAASSNDRYAVPFTLEGNEMIVTAEVNGRPIRMIFDTGASSTVFTMTHIKQLGLTVDEDETEAERHVGIAGETSGFSFPVSRMRLGPIEKSNFRISVTQGMDGHPLLGQTFYGDWQYSIDNANKVIHFLRR